MYNIDNKMDPQNYTLKIYNTEDNIVIDLYKDLGILLEEKPRINSAASKTYYSSINGGIVNEDLSLNKVGNRTGNFKGIVYDENIFKNSTILDSLNLRDRYENGLLDLYGLLLILFNGRKYKIELPYEKYGYLVGYEDTDVREKDTCEYFGRLSISDFKSNNSFYNLNIKYDLEPFAKDKIKKFIGRVNKTTTVSFTNKNNLFKIVPKFTVYGIKEDIDILVIEDHMPLDTMVPYITYSVLKYEYISDIDRTSSSASKPFIDNAVLYIYNKKIDMYEYTLYDSVIKENEKVTFRIEKYDPYGLDTELPTGIYADIHYYYERM